MMTKNNHNDNNSNNNSNSNNNNNNTIKNNTIIHIHKELVIIRLTTMTRRIIAITIKVTTAISNWMLRERTPRMAGGNNNNNQGNVGFPEKT